MAGKKRYSWSVGMANKPRTDYHKECNEEIAALRAKLAASEKARDQAEQLLRLLALEVEGAIGVSERGLREVLGNTNVAAIRLRLRQAKSVLGEIQRQQEG